jgi:hypothetical protein
MRNHRCAAVVVFSFLLLVSEFAWAGITGSISGVVTDKSGAVVVGASVVATERLGW